MACLIHCNEIAIFLQGIYIPYVWLLDFRLADSMISRLRVKEDKFLGFQMSFDHHLIYQNLGFDMLLVMS